MLGSRALCGAEHSQAPAVAERDTLVDLKNEPADALRPDVADESWDAIGLMGQEGRLLQSITLLPAATEMAIGQDTQLFPMTQFPRIHQVRYEESDPALMEFLSFALPHFPLCYAMPKDVRGGWGGSGMRIALLRMRTDVDTFWISVTRVGFAMGAHGADFTNIFFSSTLARAFDLIYFRATGEALPALIQEALSGERHIRKEYERFEKWKMSQH